MRAPLSILVVESEPEGLEALLAAVDRIGHRAHGADSLAAARSCPVTFKPEILLCSSVGWAAGGGELVAEFAERNRTLRVIVVGDESTMGQLPQFFDQGAQALLQTPLSTVELDRVIDRLMAGPASAGHRPQEVEEPAPESDDEEEEPAAPVTDEQRASARKQVQALGEELRSGTARISNISPVAMELQSLCSGDEAPDLQQLVGKIEQDPSLSAAVLRASNSVAYRGMPPVLDLEAAGRRLGTRRLGEVAQMEAIKGAFRVDQSSGWSQLLSKMWRNTVTTAHAARILAERVGGTSRGEIYSMALFHNLGEILVVDLFRKMGEPAPRDGYARGSLLNDMNHQHESLGSMLLRSWSLPGSLATIAGSHHDPSKLPLGTPIARHVWLIVGSHAAVVQAGYDYKRPHTEGPPVAAAAAALGVEGEAFKNAAEEAIEWWTGRTEPTP